MVPSATVFKHDYRGELLICYTVDCVQWAAMTFGYIGFVIVYKKPCLFLGETTSCPGSGIQV